MFLGKNKMAHRCISSFFFWWKRSCSLTWRNKCFKNSKLDVQGSWIRTHFLSFCLEWLILTAKPLWAFLVGERDGASEAVHCSTVVDLNGWVTGICKLVRDIVNNNQCYRYHRSWTGSTQPATVFCTWTSNLEHFWNSFCWSGSVRNCLTPVCKNLFCRICNTLKEM